MDSEDTLYACTYPACNDMKTNIILSKIEIQPITSCVWKNLWCVCKLVVHILSFFRLRGNSSYGLLVSKMFSLVANLFRRLVIGWWGWNITLIAPIPAFKYEDLGFESRRVDPLPRKHLRCPWPTARKLGAIIVSEYEQTESRANLHLFEPITLEQHMLSCKKRLKRTNRLREKDGEAGLG